MCSGPGWGDCVWGLLVALFRSSEDLFVPWTRTYNASLIFHTSNSTVMSEGGSVSTPVGPRNQLQQTNVGGFS